MKCVKIGLLICLVTMEQRSFALKKDGLTALAESQTLKEIIAANHRAQTEEVLREACQQQIELKRWPLSCWQWLENARQQQTLSEKKQQEWTRYLNSLCDQLVYQKTLAKPPQSTSLLWRASHCGQLAKKFGPAFEDSHQNE